MECPFCHMDGEEGRMLEQDELAMVFLSNKRRAKGHILVVPKRHVEEPWKLTAEEWARIGELLRKYQQRIVAKLGVGCDMDQRYRPWIRPMAFGKQDHVHFHLVPRAANDMIEQRITTVEKDLWQELTPQEIAEVMPLLSD